MRRFVRVRTGLPCALAVVLSLLVLAGCGKDNATTNAANARTDATLQTLATQAWSDAGYTGQTAASTDPSNTGGMSTGTSSALSSAVTQAEASNGISSVSSAGTLQQTIQAIQTQGTALALALSQPGASPLATTTVTLNNVVTCSVSGTATVTAASAPRAPRPAGRSAQTTSRWR